MHDKLATVNSCLMQWDHSVDCGPQCNTSDRMTHVLSSCLHIGHVFCNVTAFLKHSEPGIQSWQLQLITSSVQYRPVHWVNLGTFHDRWCSHEWNAVHNLVIIFSVFFRSILKHVLLVCVSHLFLCVCVSDLWLTSGSIVVRAVINNDIVYWSWRWTFSSSWRIGRSLHFLQICRFLRWWHWSVY